MCILFSIGAGGTNDIIDEHIHTHTHTQAFCLCVSNMCVSTQRRSRSPQNKTQRDEQLVRVGWAAGDLLRLSIRWHIIHLISPRFSLSPNVLPLSLLISCI